MRLLALVLCCTLPCWSPAQTMPLRTPVADLRPLLVAALDAPNGTAYGVLVGDTADTLARTFRSSAPVLIDVSTEQRHAQAGCSRLQLVFRQDDVTLPGAAAPRRQTIAFGINYCRDGQAPRDVNGRKPS